MAVFFVVLLIHLMINASVVNRTKGAANFIVIPPNTLYVSAGETAKLKWDYTVDNRTEEFDVFSPKWLFYADNGTVVLIAHESIFNNWEWSINRPTCPARLLNPVRVSKESTATLVIHNVTLDDSGTYGCTLVLATRNPVTSKVNLVITSYPIITLNLSSPSIPMNASRPFNINCFALGTPTPNVTWQTVEGKVSEQGLGKATINIKNVRRVESRIYKCCATNNPNKPAVCKTTLISDNQDINGSKTCISEDPSKIITLRCNASGVSSQQFTWYATRTRIISQALHNVTAGGTLELVTIKEDRYGLYKCKAAKVLCKDNHYISTTQTVPTSTSIDASLSSPAYAELSTRNVHQDKSRTKCDEKSCSILFFQGSTFATSHLIVTSISVAGNIVMAIFVYFIYKRADLQTGWKRRSYSQRSFHQGSSAIKTDGLELEDHETAVIDTPSESPDPIPPKLNNKKGSRKPEAAVGDERKQNENHEEQHFLSGRQHLYQQLSDGLYLSKEHDYQSLHRETGEKRRPSKSPCVKQEGNDTTDVNHHQQGREYQELHLYSSLE